MKLLFDQNLSHRLVGRLADLFPGSQHVRSLGLAEADDLEIWKHAAEHGFAIVTQDEDYAEWSALHGSPPKVVWIRCGNAPTSMIERKIRGSAEKLHLAGECDDIEVVEII